MKLKPLNRLKKAKLLNEIKQGLKEAIKISKGEAKGYSMADLLGGVEVA